MTELEPRLMEMDLGPLFGLWFQSLFIGITMWALYILSLIHISRCPFRYGYRRKGYSALIFGS